VAAQAQDLLPGVGVPDLYLRVGVHRKKAAERSEAVAVGAEGHRLDGSMVAAQGELFSAGLRVPYLEHVLAARGEPPAVGTEPNTSDRPG
jgi:hypothetical protein